MPEDVNIKSPVIGRYQTQPQGFKAFVPEKFPPTEGVAFSNAIAKKHAEAVRLIGKLDGITQLIPDKNYFLRMFIRRDASSSSQIEGTMATMMDAVEAENKERRSGLPDDVDDILHYIEAVDYGLERVKTLPLSLRFIEELHEKLMRGARSTHHSYPGEFRTSQNWIGGTSPANARFVPPPVHEMKMALSDLEDFVHAEDDFLHLLKAGLLHAQFETIHPFSDGNGRTGRMLVTLYLWHVSLLEVPVLYLSSYFKKHQQVYYERLNGYHSDPAQIEGWLDFFLDGVIVTAKSAIETCQKVTDLREKDMRKAQGLGKASAQVTINILRELYGLPVIGIADIIAWTGYSRQGAYNALKRLEDLGILQPLNKGHKYAQRYIYGDYFKLFTEVEEPQG